MSSSSFTVVDRDERHEDAGGHQRTDFGIVGDGHGSSLEILSEQVDDGRQVVQQEVRSGRCAVRAPLGRQEFVETVEERRCDSNPCGGSLALAALGAKACASVDDPLAELGGQLIEVRHDALADRCCSLVGRHGVEIGGSQQPTVVAHLPKRTAVLTEVVLMGSAAAAVELVRLESELSRELRDRAE